jgi:hypothetical protein
VAVAKGRGNDQMPAPTIEPTTIIVSANSENFCVPAAGIAPAISAETIVPPPRDRADHLHFIMISGCRIGQGR